MKKFKALGYYIVLKRIQPKTTTNSYGLELTDAHKNEIRYIKGEVVSAGPIAEGINVGDIVLYDKMAGNNLEAEDDVLKCVTVKDIILIYEDGEE